MKKLISTLLVILITLSTLSALGLVTTSAASVKDLEYDICDGEVTITGCDEYASGELIIPNKIEGYPVTKIYESAFSWCTSLKSITIPDSVTDIGYDAFSHCECLKTVTIGNGVTGIEQSTFFQCTSLESVTIGNSVTSIGPAAFEECTNLKSIVIPDSVTSIGDWAFLNCENLESITIPDSVKFIDCEAFGYNFDRDKLESKKIDKFIIYGYSKTEAERYAKENGFIFIAINSEGHIHSIVTDSAITPTCTDSGKTEGSHCSVCNEIIKVQEEIPAIGHNDKDNDGKCDICGEKITDNNIRPSFIRVIIAYLQIFFILISSLFKFGN